MANKSFWHKLPKPFFVLAPMADVTDPVFRQMVVRFGKPDVLYTEFVSANGLCSVGRKKLLKNLRFTEQERPIIAQLFTANPEKMEEAARLVAKLGFDGLDINMGCPDKTIEKQGAGAALMKNPQLAREIIRAAKAGAPNLPLSIKTRLGFNTDILEEWLPELLAEKPEAIIIHARTRKEMSKVPARWERIKDAVEIAKGSGVLIIGNGDVGSIEEGKALAEKTGCDGVMIGRGIFKNPWIFENKKVKNQKIKKLKLAIEHAKLFEKFWGKGVKFAKMKKFFKIYCADFPGASDLRKKLMEAKDYKETEEIIGGFINLKSEI
ncbi:tRNA-dihydrouridine synthase family protein [Candidatus Microgenomates bacterium]|nr:tRNA-dihydrouridine synthase family protein [Candidatus Microgenomates bacterium]